MKRFLTAIFAVAALTLVGGCDSVSENNTFVRSFNFTFRVADADINGPVASVQYDVPSITRRVAEGGAVLVYFREQGTWTAMPFTYGIDDAELLAVSYTVTLGYGFENRFLEVFYEVSIPNPEENLLLDLPDRELKVVVIDGIGIGKNGVDLTDYEAVKAYYGLED